MLDLNTGAQLGSTSSGSGVDIIGYNPRLAHAYLPGGASGTIAIIGVSTKVWQPFLTPLKQQRARIALQRTVATMFTSTIQTVVQSSSSRTRCLLNNYVESRG